MTVLRQPLLEAAHQRAPDPVALRLGADADHREVPHAVRRLLGAGVDDPDDAIADRRDEAARLRPVRDVGVEHAAEELRVIRLEQGRLDDRLDRRVAIGGGVLPDFGHDALLPAATSCRTALGVPSEPSPVDFAEPLGGPHPGKERTPLAGES